MLVLGDVNIPHRANAIPEKFKRCVSYAIAGCNAWSAGMPDLWFSCIHTRVKGEWRMTFSRFDCAFWFIVLILILLLGAQRTCVYDFRMLVPNKMQHVICTGNVGNEQYAELRELAPNLHVVAGDFDAGNSGSLGQNVSFPETRVVQVGDFQIGVIHGHQIIP